jgi:hypothetical protein
MDAKIVEPFSESVFQGYEFSLEFIPRFARFSQ